MFKYLWDCLNPSIPRDQCTTKYDFGLWGHELEPIVRYVKASNCPRTFKEFFEGFKTWAQAEN